MYVLEDSESILYSKSKEKLLIISQFIFIFNTMPSELLAWLFLTNWKADSKNLRMPKDKGEPKTILEKDGRIL